MHDASEDRPSPPRRPERPEPREAPGSRSSLMPVVFVMVPVVIVTIGLVAFLGRAGLLMIVAVATVPGFILLHYLLWGRWLARRLREQAEADQDDDGT